MSDITDSFEAPDWDDVVASEEELIENEVGYISGPVIQADGKKGRFVNTATKEETPTIRGVALSKFESQLLFGGENSREFSDFDGWVCRNDYKNKSLPRVNEQAPKRILQRLAALGGGVDCAGCDLRRFGPNEERPDCGSRWAIVFLDDRYDDPLPVIIKGTSISPMHNFFKSDAFRNKKGELQPSMVRRIELSMVQEGKGSKGYYRVEFAALGYLTDREQFNRLRQDGLARLKSFQQAALAAPRPRLAALTAGVDMVDASDSHANDLVPEPVEVVDDYEMLDQF